VSAGFAQLRRGLIDQLVDGRITGDEYGVFCLMVQLADYRSGIWRGSGVALATYLHGWSIRKCQRLLTSLKSKGYIALRHIRGRKGNYEIAVERYSGPVEKVTTPQTSLFESDDTIDVRNAKVTTPATTLKEVKQEVKLKKKAAQALRGPSKPLRTEQEQRRIVAARDTREHKEVEARRDAFVGAGPISCGFSQAYLEQLKARENERQRPRAAVS
jgi:hypothetical protein